MQLPEIEVRLQAWAQAVHGASATVTGVRPMPGNAGLSFGFQLRRATHPTMGLVVRLAPPGVRREGNNDVLRQVPLLRVLAASAIPVAPLHWWTEDDAWFGTAAFMVGLLAGSPLHMFSAQLSCDAGPGEIGGLLDQAVDALARLHEVPTDGLAEWDAPRPSTAEIEWSLGVLARAGDEKARQHGAALAETLRARRPGRERIGIAHGDYQTNNILYADGSVTGIVDWELACIGAQLIDVGWLVMMTDPACWAPAHAARMRVIADPVRLVSRYEEASGRAAPDAPWYVGLACLKFGAIVAYNVKLHRQGKREDELFEALAPSIGHLFDHGAHMATTTASRR